MAANRRVAKPVHMFVDSLVFWFHVKRDRFNVERLRFHLKRKQVNIGRWDLSEGIQGRTRSVEVRSWLWMSVVEYGGPPFLRISVNFTDL